ncbi:hypothetical protein A2Y99_02430 [Candidatus Gottesmanbacteria bacterium RBG_13_37_7]|uniref:DUF1648 domain-containing protein n=1 Tax=Candidatus Gottesmanbacteria bacterium RBG_13_37_7 TaxID=1798369 RepID=A0A1F5YJ24_9BACT|nr:MAG: hypothetical protein A2Y99_02430 [Candidatus Gottesmanbacteria bacterium RBG_13_37_7]
MKQNIISLLHDNYISRASIFYLSIQLLFIIILIWKWNKLPPELPLFYSLPRSSDQLGTPLSLLILPVSSVIFWGLNLFIAALIYPKEKVCAQIFISFSVIVSMLLLISFIKIVFLIT